MTDPARPRTEWGSRVNLGALLLFQAAALAILYWPVVSGSAAFFQRDILNYWKPHVDWILKSLASGQTIGWNPGLMFGVPMLADPNFQLFYPPTWLIALMPPTSAYGVMVIAHGLWGGLGIARVLRDRGETNGAIAGALIFSLSGPFVSLGNLWHHYCGVAWIPWVFWAVERLVRTRGASWRPLALVLGAQALAGSAESVMMAVFLAVLPACFSNEKTRFLGLMRAVVVAFGLCAVQWIPTAILVGQSARSAFSPDAKLHWSVNPELLHEALIPGQRPTPPVVTGAELPGDDDLRLLVSFYLGAASLPFFLLGLPRNRVLAGLGLLLLVLSFGRHLGGIASELLAITLPFRYPSKLLAGVVVAWAITCGSGVHRAFSLDGRGRVVPVVLPLLALAVLPFFLSVPLGFDQRLLRAVVFGAVALAWLPSSGKLKRVGIPLLLMSDLLPAALPIHAYTKPATPYYRPPILDAVLGRGPNPRVFAALIGEAWIKADLKQRGHTSETSFHLAVAETMQPSLSLGFGLRYGFHADFTGLGSLDADAFQEFVNGRFHEDLPRYLDLGAIDAVVSVGSTNPLGTPKGDAEFRGLMSEPIRVDYWGRVPRASIATRVETRKDARRALEFATSASFRPGVDVVLESEVALENPAPASSGTATARIVLDSNDRVDVEAVTQSGGWLVLRDSFRNGWSASVNGVESRIAKADVLFRAVRVPPGRSAVSFRYSTPGLSTGALLGLFSLLAILAGAFARAPRPLVPKQPLPEA